MADISEWSAVEAENTHIDELTLSGESGLYINKIMCAVKAKEDEQDAKLAQVQGALVFRGTVADMAALEAVEDPDNGDTYSVTALGGENYAWNGEAWDSLGTSDANVVHKTGEESIAGDKTFTDDVITLKNNVGLSMSARESSGSIINFFQKSGDVSTVTCVVKKVYNGKFQIGVKPTPANASWFSGPMLELAPAGTAVLTASNGSDTASLVCASDGSIQWGGQPLQTTSDQRKKTELEEIPDAVLDAWGDVMWGQFRYLDAVERKGEAARLHVGLVAQAVLAVFESHGLDACAYGILCHKQPTEDDPADVWTVRYDEAEAMEIAWQRRALARLEARLDSLEAGGDGV